MSENMSENVDMDVVLLRQLLARPVAYHPCLACSLGSVPAAIMLSQALFWSDKIPRKRPRGCPEGPGWIYKTANEWTEETGLSLKEQQTARKKLIKSGVWEEKRQGVPCRVYGRVIAENLEKILKNPQFTRKGKTSFDKSCKLESPIGKNKNRRKGKSTHIPPERTERIPPPEFEPSGDQGGGGESLSDQNQGNDQVDEYIRLSMKYGARGGGPVDDPAVWTKALRRRLMKQGWKLTDMDKGQLATWLKKEAARSDTSFDDEYKGVEQLEEEIL